jgi:hypothetical protein
MNSTVLYYSDIPLLTQCPRIIATSFPGSSLFSRKDTGNSWSRGSQILGAKFKLYLGRGGRGVCLFVLGKLQLVCHSFGR